MNSAGKVMVPAAREMVTRPSSIGWRMTSRVERLNSGKLVQEEDAVVRQAYFAGRGIDGAAEQADIRDGMMRRAKGPGGDKGMFSIEEAANGVNFVMSMASSRVIGGMMVPMRFASMDLPEPGGPIIRRLWPPATATSMARFAFCWPFTSAKSISYLRCASNSAVIFSRTGRERTLPGEELEGLAQILDAIDVEAIDDAASRAFASGTMRAFFPARRAAMATGSTPLTGRTAPLSASSPTMQ